MRKLFAIVILLCMLYFVGGWIAVKFSVVTRDDYFAYAGIVGGLASVAGLLALTRPAISQSDFESVELDTLRSVADTVEQLQILQSQHTRTIQEIDNLEIRKKEMELLVKKASLALFLKEQYSYHERQVRDEVAKNPHLQKSLENATASFEKISALDEEISIDPNVQQLRQIIDTAGRKKLSLDDALSDLLPFARGVFLLMRAVSRTIIDVTRIVR
ncbi:MAG: hypothetical protein V4476_17215 [Pseudomonadota bacterium]